MTPANEEKLLKQVEQIDLTVRNLEKRIVGDKYAQPPIKGLVDVVDGHINEIYGEHETQHEGLKPRVNALETEVKKLKDEKNRVYWTLAGFTLLLTAYEIWKKVYP